jgi:hypothetical protein
MSADAGTGVLPDIEMGQRKLESHCLPSNDPISGTRKVLPGLVTGSMLTSIKQG